MVRLECFKPEMRSGTISTQFFLAVGTIFYGRGIIAFLYAWITDIDKFEFSTNEKHTDYFVPSPRGNILTYA
jgi:hypothetical protein